MRRMSTYCESLAVPMYRPERVTCFRILWKGRTLRCYTCVRMASRLRRGKHSYLVAVDDKLALEDASLFNPAGWLSYV